ncbi:hypothetical protein ACH5RR_031818 [Cinchona calisaya]|uniref:Uncharacterized protein n=1 Tax=Cinchona calisaya TaxID=153742 RepID=A0ABD2YGC6_9GENT
MEKTKGEQPTNKKTQLYSQGSQESREPNSLQYYESPMDEAYVISAEFCAKVGTQPAATENVVPINDANVRPIRSSSRRRVVDESVHNLQETSKKEENIPVDKTVRRFCRAEFEEDETTITLKCECKMISSQMAHQKCVPAEICSDCGKGIETISKLHNINHETIAQKKTPQQEEVKENSIFVSSFLW